MEKAETESRLSDILIFMSDQHTPYYSGFYGSCCVDTPNLTQLCREGTAFDECYTSSPLCTPARMSFVSARRPAKTGIFHKSTLPDTTMTFLHYLVKQGYETVLIGRMHFQGPDQYHGFTKHLAGDMTPVTWNYMYCRDAMNKERGVYVQTDTFSGQGAASLSGGGTSPVLEYDRFVIDAALNYLSQPHEKPQFICVSIYGPHFPYVAPKDLYEKYLARVQLPVSYMHDVDCDAIKHYQVAADEEVALSCQAAYCGMIENMDRQFGDLRKAFDRFCDDRGSKRAVMYLSDHGDQCGDRHIFGKETFYERSAKIPFLAAGDGIAVGRRITEPVSIMDIGPTILEYTGAQSMYDVDGISVAAALAGGQVPPHPVYSEMMERPDGIFKMGPSGPDVIYSHGFMLRSGTYKYITYEGYETQDTLFDLSADPEELCNLAQQEPALLKKLQAESRDLLLHEEANHNYRREERAHELMIIYEMVRGDADESLRWKGASPDAALYPEICVKNPAYFKDGKPVPKEKRG